ncbi:hypothetical protein OG762_52225 (plasmid) [Streptomyces sp. NBC_01136]|uniref:hypothetical protein n=1 Tax=unclassified Streptomyces TaxID=2593676 RepID=UPI002F9080B8|nr:hypothetical protein OG762_52225 [Streptomyces sp. NBC_01136]
MTLDLQRAATRRMRRLLFAAGGVIVVLAAVVVVLVANSGGSPSAAPGPSSSAVPSSSASPLPTASSDGGYVAPEKWVVLPSGKGKKDGLPVQFGHTPEGAAAAAVASVRYGWSWDPDAAATAAGVYTVPSEAATVKEEARKSTTNSRLSAGAPGTGALPSGAHMNVFVIGVQFTAATADEVKVSVLARVVYTPGSGTAETTQLIATTNTYVWTANDWHSKTGAPQTSPDASDLGTAGFNTAGWSAIQEGDTR